MSTLHQLVTIVTIARIVTFVANLIHFAFVSKVSVAVRTHKRVDCCLIELRDGDVMHVAVVEAHRKLVHGRRGLREQLLGVAEVVRKRRVCCEVSLEDVEMLLLSAKRYVAAAVRDHDLLEEVPQGQWTTERGQRSAELNLRQCGSTDATLGRDRHVGIGKSEHRNDVFDVRGRAGGGRGGGRRGGGAESSERLRGQGAEAFARESRDCHK